MKSNINEVWNIEGKLHSESGPAVEIVREKQSIYSEFWKNGRYEKFEGTRHGLINPKTPIPSYPQNMVLAKGMRLGDLLDNEYSVFLDISNWISNSCYCRENFFSSHGDFGAQAKVTIKALKISTAFEEKLKEKVTVKIIDEDEKGVDIDDLFNPERPRPETDPLGLYIPKEKQIVLFIRKIVKCANRLDQAIHDNVKIYKKIGMPCAMTLFNIVYLHELGHAIHHSRTGFCDKWHALDVKILEQLAQLFARTCIEEHGNQSSKNVFEELEQRQSSIYREWRKLASTLDWNNCIQRFKDRPEIVALNTFEELPINDGKACLDIVSI